MIGPVGFALCVVCALAEKAGVTIGAGVGTVAVVVVGWLLPLLPLLLLGMSVDAAHSAAKLTKIAATVLRRTAAMIGRLAMPLSVVRRERPEPVSRGWDVSITEGQSQWAGSALIGQNWRVNEARSVRSDPDSVA